MARPRFQSLACFNIGVRNSEKQEDQYDTKNIDHGNNSLLLEVAGRRTGDDELCLLRAVVIGI
jgi:hypothetical protein